MENKAINDLLIKIRRDLHKIPEPSLKEYKTSSYIVNLLSENNIKFHKILDTGIIAYIEGEKKEPLIAFRADIDGLPIKEETGLSFSSQNEGFMHACGHDFHMSIVLALALYFKKNPPPSSLLFIFQPGEEGSGGAKLMLESNIWNYYGKPDYIFGFHVWPSLEKGKIAFCEGEAWAGSVEFIVNFFGKGGHGAYPHESSDLLYLFADWYTNIQTFISRKIDSQQSTLLTCGMIKGAVKSNIIPDNLQIGGTLRYFDDYIKNILLNFSKEYGENLAKLYNAKFEQTILSDYIPLINNKELAKKIYDISKSKKYINCDQMSLILSNKKVMVADDIAYFIRDIGKGIYFFLGVKKDEKSINQSLHTKDFNPDEDALTYGFNFFKFLVENL
jgi:amidohydrolase